MRRYTYQINTEKPRHVKYVFNLNTSAELIASETHYRSFFESARVGLLVADALSGRIIDANPFLLTLLGISAEKLINKIIWDVDCLIFVIANQDQFSVFQQEEYTSVKDLIIENTARQTINVAISSHAFRIGSNKVVQFCIRDISSRKKKEVMLTHTKIGLNTLVQNNSDLIWLKDSLGVYMYCNIMFEKFFGASKTDIIGKTDYDFKDKELSDFFRTHDLAARTAGKPTSNEEWVTFADDGHSVFLDTTKTPLYHSDGTFVGVMGVGRDITERRHSEMTLMQSEAKFKSIFEGSNDAIILMRENQVFDCNPKTLEMFGVANTAMLNDIELLEFSPERQSDGRFSAEAAMEQIALAHKQGDAHFDWIYRRYNGEEFPAIVHLSSFVVGSDPIHQVTIRDLTRMEQELLKANKQLALHYEEKEMRAAELLVANKELVFQIGEKEKRTAELLMANQELIFQNQEREKRAAELVIACKELVFQNDEKGKREEELMVANIELDFQSEEKKIRAAELIVARTKAKESDNLKTAFLHNMSHEIRTPLNAIVGFSSLLNDENISKEDIKEFTDLITLSGKRLLEIVNNVLDMSKIQTGQVKTDWNPVDVNLIFSKLHAIFLPMAIEKKISFNFCTQNDTAITILTDATKLYQILSNLINNALKFTKAGNIDFGYEIKDKVMQFYVKDTGIGIPEKLHKSIFNRFIQAEHSLSKSYEGAGLGLAICRGYVKLLGGQIWVESEINKGTTFFFTLPYHLTAHTSKAEFNYLRFPVKRNSHKPAGRISMY